MWILVMGSMLNAATVGPLLNSSIVVIATDLNRTITEIAVISGYNLLAVGCTGYPCDVSLILVPSTARTPANTVNVVFSSSAVSLPLSVPQSARLPKTRIICFSQLGSFKAFRLVHLNR
jgi:hypothetical protein